MPACGGRAHSRGPYTSALQREAQRVLKQVLDLAQELGALRAVAHAVVGGERDGHQLARDDLAVADSRLVLHRADAEDRGLSGLDDRDQRLDAVHAEVADRERALAHLRRPQHAAPGARRQILALARYGA